MKWKRSDPFETWEVWFAWYPVLVDLEYVWLEHVIRKREMYGHDPVWVYRMRTP